MYKRIDVRLIGKMFFAVKLGVEYGVRIEILFKSASAIMSPSLQTVIRNAGIVGDVKPACKQIGWARHFAIRNFPDRPGGVLLNELTTPRHRGDFRRST